MTAGSADPARAPSGASSVGAPDAAAGGPGSSARPATAGPVRVGGPARRPAPLPIGIAAAVTGAALVGLTALGPWPLVLAVAGLQLLLVLGFLALVDAPADGGAFVVAGSAAVAADALALTGDGAVGGLAGVVALALVASLVHQLVRPQRTRVTESLADTLVVVALVTGAAAVVALVRLPGGQHACVVALAAAAAALLAGRVGDALAPRPALAVGATRGWPGLLLGLGAGALAAVLAAGAGAELTSRQGALLGLAVAAAAAAADLAVDLGGSELREGWRDARRVAALRPVSLLLPFAVVGPVAYAAGRLVLQ